MSIFEWVYNTCYSVFQRISGSWAFVCGDVSFNIENAFGVTVDPSVVGFVATFLTCVSVFFVAVFVIIAFFYVLKKIINIFC